MFEAPPDGAVMRFDEIRPTWNTMHAREPGHLRWIISYYGGREGYVNDNPENGLFSDVTAAGTMWLAAGNRQFGVHEHTMTEIYVILKGRVESIEPGRRQKAGPLDCLYMPPHAPHAVQAVGDEDVLLLWAHDQNELWGESQYYDENDSRWSEGTPAVQLVRWADLSPRWDAPGAREGGTMRSWSSWAGDAGSDFPIDPEVGALSSRVSLGSTMLPPGNSHVPHSHPFAEHYVVISGRAVVVGGDPGRILGPNDYVGFGPGQIHALRTVGTEPLHVLWFHEGVVGKTTYEAAE